MNQAPSIDRAALLLVSEGQRSKIKTALAKVAEISPERADAALQSLVQKGFVALAKRDLALTEKGRAWLAGVPDWILKLSAVPRVRAWAALEYLNISDKDRQQPQLTNANVVRACIVAKSLAEDRFRGILGTPTATIEAAMRAVVEVQLRSAIGLDLPPMSEKFEGFKDPLLRQIFLQFESDVGEDIHVGFQRLLLRINTSFTGAAHSPWGMIFATENENPMLAATAVRSTGFLGKLGQTLSTAAARTPSGWVPISVAWDLFRASEPITLSDFKDRLLQEARNGSVELNPLSVSSLLAARVREQSETVMGGRKFHYLRLAA